MKAFFLLDGLAPFSQMIVPSRLFQIFGNCHEKNFASQNDVRFLFNSVKRREEENQKAKRRKRFEKACLCSSGRFYGLHIAFVELLSL